MTITMDDFSKYVLKPSVLAGIRSGAFDNALVEWLSDCPPEDPDILAAAVERLHYLAANPPKDPLEGVKPGTRLRIKIPENYAVTD